MPYTAEKPARRETNEELRARIPGWGVDLDPADRPSVPRERYAPDETGAHWAFPDRQEGPPDRERSIEHMMLTPVYGTSVPLRGFSGIIRRIAYARFSEGRAAHWLLLILGDRVDAIASRLRSLISRRPDDPITETGVLSERRRHGIRSRFGHRRADVKHSWMDPIVVAGPWILAILLVAVGVRSAVKRR